VTLDREFERGGVFCRGQGGGEQEGDCREQRGEAGVSWVESLMLLIIIINKGALCNLVAITGLLAQRLP
jgi:hypothetical protein